MKSNICGPKIRKLRKEAGMKQEELRAALEVDHGITLKQSDISEIESGVRGVRDYEVKAFAEIFKVSADLILSN